MNVTYHEFVQASLVVSAACSIFLAIVVLFITDGPAWSAFRLMTIATAAATIGSVWLTWGSEAVVDIVAHPGFSLVAWGRLVASVAQIALAVMLWRNRMHSDSSS